MLISVEAAASLRYEPAVMWLYRDQSSLYPTSQCHILYSPASDSAACPPLPFCSIFQSLPLALLSLCLRLLCPSPTLWLYKGRPFIPFAYRFFFFSPSNIPLSFSPSNLWQSNKHPLQCQSSPQAVTIHPEKMLTCYLQSWMSEYLWNVRLQLHTHTTLQLWQRK